MTVEVENNPFRPDGELAKEVDDLLKSSTICRDQLIINDPSLAYTVTDGAASAHHSPAKVSVGPSGSGDPSMVGPITCEVTADHVSPPPAGQTAQQVERVKIKKQLGGMKCCVIM